MYLKVALLGSMDDFAYVVHWSLYLVDFLGLIPLDREDATHRVVSAG